MRCCFCNAEMNNSYYQSEIFILDNFAHKKCMQENKKKVEDYVNKLKGSSC